MSGLQTEFTFTLPKGYVDKQGVLHRRGTMRLATARDEIEPLRDPRISGADDPFLTVIVLSRVVTELGTITQVTPNVIENLFTADLAFLQDVYGIINFGDPADLELLRQTVAQELHREPVIDADDPGEPEDAADADPWADPISRAPRGRRAVIEEVKASTGA